MERKPVPGRRATIGDVAELAGVSKQTVSRAINDKGEIGAATKERVLEAARSLGYRPSRFARGLRLQDSVTVGLLLSDVTNPYYPEVASGVLEVAEDRGWHVVVGDSRGDRRRELEALQVLARQADALIGQCSSPDEELARELPGVPIVLLDHPPGHRGHGSVRIDFTSGMRQAVDHLVLDRGRRRIGVLEGTPRANPATERRLSAEQRLREHGLPAGADWTAHAVSHTVAGGEAALAELLTARPDMDGVVCYNDQIAIGAMRELKRAGRRVPADVSVIGFDGLPLGELVTPSLTSVHIDKARLGRLAVQEVARLLADPTAPPVPDAPVVHPELVVRGST
ncbi:LacI family transcriptional regulator [Mangrovactinospora gilvigrisea]|uniref:LacI family transcriptional regulator n=1 Tax=Mangrovactinospora gilvigrisea TaxID=1428644 RepID=A0A1J7B9Y0_9ACTN|nr:LacI family transcriptional regulator [Mangrovactinospora gilvigrisea]